MHSFSLTSVQRHFMHVAAFTLLLTACQPITAPSHPVESAPEAEHAAQANGHTHWGYSGEEGPDHWGELDSAFATCAVGHEQSPIDIRQAEEANLTDIAFFYQPSLLHIFNNGHTVQANYDEGSYIELDGHRYDVLQFHYHAPSEHTLNGKTFPAEFHIVHKDAEGKLAVVGVLVEEGAENPAFAQLTKNLPVVEGPVVDVESLQVNALAFLPTEHTTYRYPGSLTTPPCTEGVSWLVMTTPIQMSATQLDAFEAIHVGNNRPVQSLHGRTLAVDVSATQ